MRPFDLVMRCPADVPEGAAVFPISDDCDKVLQVCHRVRPDIRIVSKADDLRPEDWLAVSGPDFLHDIQEAREIGLRNRSMIIPEIGGSYHEYFAVPQALLRHARVGTYSLRCGI